MEEVNGTKPLFFLFCREHETADFRPCYSSVQRKLFKDMTCFRDKDKAFIENIKQNSNGNG